tara:strand:- start:4127 stop:5062 length:936 start_codon:yes stop_codon:yes gene_type:complete
MIDITTPSRIHITLLDLNASIGRIDGGIGLALESPRIQMSASKGKKINVNGPMKERIAVAARKVLNHIGETEGIDIRIDEAFPQHIGLGSGTQISLATGMAVSKIYKKMPKDEIAKITGRGGTSGIGVAVFKQGGFILDGGHSIKIKKEFNPTSISKAPPPPIITRKKFPNWKVGLIIPKTQKLFSGSREVRIFKKYCPLPLDEVQKLSHLILMKLLPALVEKDIEVFGESINLIQTVGFKKVELGLQLPWTKKMLDIAQSYSYGAGISSFGPLIYCFPKNEEKLLKNIPKKKADVIFTKACNEGARISKS